MGSLPCAQRDAATACTVSMTAARNVTGTFNTSGSGTGGTRANPVTFTDQTGNFNTTGAACYRTNMNIQGWGCSNFGDCGPVRVAHACTRGEAIEVVD